MANQPDFVFFMLGQDLLLGHLIRMSASGGNYLLNVGPSPLGEIPAPAAERFRGIGKWLQTNRVHSIELRPTQS